MNFLWPWIFLLAPVPLWFEIRNSLPGTTGIVDISPRLAAALQEVDEHKGWTFNIDKTIAWLIWLSLLAALAQPGKTDSATVQPASGRAISVVIDLSGSMERDDFEWQGKKANRLTVVQAVASEFIIARSGDRVSLVLFASEAYIASPLTFDLKAVQHQLAVAGIGMAGRSTSIGDALGLAIQSLRDDPASEKAIILLSDGTNNAGAVEPENAASLANERGVRIHTIALGSDREREDAYSMAPSADLDEETLKSIAQNANGEFFRAKTSQDLIQIYSTINALESAEVDTPPIVVRRDLRHFPLYFLIGILLIRAVRGISRA